MIHIQSFTFNAFQENTFVLYDETNECIIIDPGCNDQSERDSLTDFISENSLKPVRLLNTHCHIDHIMGNKFVCETYDLKLEINKIDEAVLDAAVQYAHLYNINYDPSPSPAHFLTEKDIIQFGISTLEILFVPGHSPGHIAFVNKEQKFVIGGDVLFQQSIGRTDLPGGNFETLIASIKDKFFTLDDDFQVYVGHGPSTNIGCEKVNNPVLIFKK